MILSPTVMSNSAGPAFRIPSHDVESRHDGLSQWRPEVAVLQPMTISVVDAASEASDVSSAVAGMVGIVDRFVQHGSRAKSSQRRRKRGRS